MAARTSAFKGFWPQASKGDKETKRQNARFIEFSGRCCLLKNFFAKLRKKCLGGGGGGEEKWELKKKDLNFEI